MHDLEGRHLAVEFGTEGDLEARTWQRRLHQIDITLYEIASQALDAVLAGEADAALVDAISAHLWLNDHNGLEIAPEYVTHDLYAVAVQVNNVKLWQAIDQALTSLIEDGTVEGYLMWKNDNSDPAMGASSNDSDLYTLGARFTGAMSENMKYRAEFAGQTGKKNDATVCAFGFNSQLSYLLNDPKKSSFHAGYEYLSGDDPETATNESFDSLWARWPRASPTS